MTAVQLRMKKAKEKLAMFKQQKLERQKSQQNEEKKGPDQLEFISLQKKSKSSYDQPSKLDMEKKIQSLYNPPALTQTNSNPDQQRSRPKF